MTNQENKAVEAVAMDIIGSINLNTLGAQIQKINQFQQLIQKNMVAIQDYGIIPGTKKPTLLKPGAEKICMLMGLCSEYDIVDSERNFKEGFFQYQVKCKLIKNGIVITEGLGSCNNHEKKYATADPCSIENTILKMAKKRSLVDAALMVGSLSNVFTQDTEDMAIKEDSSHKVFTDNSGLISQAQAKRLFAISQGNSLAVKDVLKKHGLENSKDIKKIDYETICKEVQDLVEDKQEVISEDEMKKIQEEME